MAQPTVSAHWPMRARAVRRQMERQREQEAFSRQQWELLSQYYKEQDLHSNKQAAWSSRQSFQQSMAAYHRERLKEEEKLSLERRRTRLKAMLQEEKDQLEAELREFMPDRSVLSRQLVQKTDNLRLAREERRKKLAQELLKEHWKKNNPELRKVESALHKDHVVSQWQEQAAEKQQQEAAAQVEQKRFENEYERTRQEALERMKRAEEKKKADERERAEALLKQMEELKLREKEASRLKKEQEALQAEHWEVERLEDERKKAEESRKKTEIRRFLVRQYRAQLKRRAQQIQEELEADRKILAALMEGEDEEQKLQDGRRERAMADAAWMKHVIEEQLKLEKQREAEFEACYREDAQHMWDKREALWERERKARERLMREVLAGRQRQLEEKLQENRKCQEESLRRREELIQVLELERETQHKEKEQEEGQKTARMKEIDEQVEEQRQEQWEAQRRKEVEEEEDREVLRLQDELLRIETNRMARQGYHEKVRSRPRTAWT